ncbi:MAG: isoprenylcysteine carboxylmethyltransferase family protein [Oscillospiraceae bacterium]|nr:isoprenylcysteine carboxylmethyltransferase family protein [Oscillospiraceae bacterium]
MDKELLLDALKKFAAGVILIGLLLFVPAGTVRYPNGWLLCGVLFVPVLIMGVVLLFKAPDLLRKRLREKEEQAEQKSVVALSGLMFLVGFILAGLDYRFGWTQLPMWLVYTAAVAFLLGYGMFAEVMRENAYLSRTVEVQEDQVVIDTGLYGIVRHPMYTATVVMFLTMPLVLGSAVAFLIFLLYPILLVKRIRNEEQVLEEGLAGYVEYKQKVKYRLIPFVW